MAGIAAIAMSLENLVVFVLLGAVVTALPKKEGRREIRARDHFVW